MMFLIVMMTDSIPITTQILWIQVSKNNPNVGVCLNIKWTSKNLLLLGNPRQKLNLETYLWSIPDDNYLVLVVLGLKYRIL